MPDRLIGDAYIAIQPDTSLFRTRASSEINAALAGLRPSVKITGDAGDVDAKIAAIAAALKGINGQAHIDLDTKQAITDIAGLEAAIVALWDRLENIPVDLDDSKGLAKLYGLMAGSEALAKKLEDIGDADFDINKALAKFYSLEAGAKALQEQVGNLDANVNDGAAEATILKLGAGVKALADELDSMRADVDDAGMLAKIVTMQAAALKLAHTLSEMPVTADILPAEASLFRLTAEVAALQAKMSDVQLKAQVVLPVKPGSYSTMGTTGFSSSEAQMMDQLAMQTLAAMTDFEGLNRAMDDTSNLAPVVAAGLTKILSTDSMIISSDMGGWWGALNTQIRLFGGALEGIMPNWLADVHLWHLGADAIFEFAAAWAPALIAVGTFAAYAYPVGEKIYDQWKNINVILDGLDSGFTGAQVGLHDLGTSFDTIESAIEPSIMEAFGDYMLIIGKNAQPLADALTKVGVVIDDWGTNLVSWFGSAEKSFDSIVSSGSKDFAEIGYGFEQLGKIFGDFFKDMPGYVHILLLVGDAMLTAAADAMSFFAPLIKAALYIHGFIVYVGLATTAVLALGRAMTVGAITKYADSMGISLAGVGNDAEESTGKFNKFGTAIGGMIGYLVAGGVKITSYATSVGKVATSAGPAAAGSKLLSDAVALLPEGLSAAGVAGAAAAVIFGVALYYGLHNAASAATDFGVQMQKLITSSNAQNIGSNLTLALTQTSDKYKQVEAQLNAPLPTNPVDAYNKALQSIPQNVSAVQQQAVKNILNSQQQLVAAQDKTNQEMQKANPYSTGNQESAAYLDQIHQIIGETDNYGSRLNTLTGIFGTTGAAEAAMNLVGISAGELASETSKKFATQETQLQALALGYGYMGNATGAAGAQLDALNIASGTTAKNLQTLTQAEAGWISMVTSGDSTFTSFEQGFPEIASAMGKSATNAATLYVSIGKLKDKFAEYGGTMNGTSQAALAVRQAFDSQLSAATTLYGSLQTMATASGNTAAAQNELAHSGKDIIAQLLPFAAGSKEATAEVSALAQIMGGPATDSFSTLAKWVGNTKGAEADLDTQQAKLTISTSNLTTASKNLGNALDTAITSAQQAAIAQTANLTGATQGLAKAATSAKGAVTQAAVSMAGEYMTALERTGIGTTQSTQYLNAYLKQLGYTPAAIAAIDAQMGDSIAQWNKYDAAVTQNSSAAKAFSKDTANNQKSIVSLSNVLPGTISQLGGMWQALVKQDAAMVKSGNDATGAKTQFVNFAVQGLQLTTSQAQALWSKFGNQNLDELAAKASNTKQSFIQMAENGLHLSTEQAQALWGEFAMQNLDEMVTKGNNMKNAFISLARNGLDLTSTQASTLWNTLEHQYLDTLANKAGETEQAFVRTANQFGVTAQAAEKLWQQLHETAGNYDANVVVKVSGGGKVLVQGNVTVSESLGAVNINGVANGGIVQQKGGGVTANGYSYATGGKVPGWHNGGDNIIAMSPHGALTLQGGEAVVPKNLATHPAFTGFAKAHGIPGFASGGLLAGSVTGNADPSGVASTVGKYSEPVFTEKTTAQMIGQFGTALQGALKNAYQEQMATAGAFGGTVPGGAANLLVIAKYLMANGFNAYAAAGVAATIDGESGGNPESVGSGGFGLIGWTGNTIGLPAGYHGPTGNVQYDMSAQLRGVIGYINANGGIGPLNSAGSAIEAGDIFSSHYERPLVSLSDTRPALATQLFAELEGAANKGKSAGGRIKSYSTGGAINEPVYGQGAYSGLPYSFAENGQTEYVSNASQAAAASSPMMQPMTTYQGQTLINQNGMLIKLWQQFPQALGNALGTAGSNGVKHGYYGAQN